MPIIQPRMFRGAVRLFALLLLSNAAVGMAGNIPYHHCFYDEIHKKSKINQIAKVENLDEEEDSQTSSTFDNLRVKFSVNNFNRQNKHCEAAKKSVKDVRGVLVECKEKDIFDTQKKKDLMKIVRSAINMHAEKLKVKRLKNAIKVPELKGPLCKRFAVPECHKTAGVSNADFVLYVSSRPSSKEKMFAVGAPCALGPSGRPVVGVLMYTTEHIKFGEYSVRVAAHEIAHALGFTYKIMKNKIGDEMKTAGRRYKKTVETVNTESVKKFVYYQYRCGKDLGVELEDEKGALSVPSHSHWKRRNALEELMAPIVTTGYYTYLTLALFQDLGFYRADFDKAEVMEWGKAGGCNFFEYRCVGDGVDNSRYFCSERGSSKLHCTPGRRGMGKCSGIYRNDQIPYPYAYFWRYNWGRAYYEYYTGGESLMTDRCPIYEEDDEYSCTNKNSKAPGIKGENSWCVRVGEGKTLKDGNSAFCMHAMYMEGEVHVTPQDPSVSINCKNGKYFNILKRPTDDQMVTFECPSKEELERKGKIQKLLDSGKNEKKTDDFNCEVEEKEEEEDEEE